MESIDFKNILFKSAMCMMASDGEIHESECKEIKDLIEDTQYFTGIESEKVFADYIKDIQNRGRIVIDEFISTISESDINIVQKLLMLEVLLRIIHADNNIDKSEIAFLHNVRTKLKIHEELIKERFGTIELLEDGDKVDAIQSTPKDENASFNIKLTGNISIE